jgi:hypothetical protein
VFDLTPDVELLLVWHKGNENLKIYTRDRPISSLEPELHFCSFETKLFTPSLR